METPTAGAEATYEAMAPIYDDFTAHHEYEEWTADLLGALEPHGLRHGRLLDVACGTGKSFLPMLSRGWEVIGCDISPAMLALAKEKTAGSISLEVADMASLPEFGKFDLVWALDDAVNYLPNVEALTAALEGMRRNLAPNGLLLFDVNTLLAYRTFFAETIEVERGGRKMIWRGLTDPEVEPSSLCESFLEETGGAVAAHRHRQRHFPETEVRDILEGAGLECLAVHGFYTDGILKQPLDELAHTKAAYIARTKS